MWDKDMAEQLRSLAVLTKGMSLVLRPTSGSSQPHVTTVSKALMASSGLHKQLQYKHTHPYIRININILELERWLNS